MSLGWIMIGVGGCLLLTGILWWICILAKGKKEKQRMEQRMREKY